MRLSADSPLIRRAGPFAAHARPVHFAVALAAALLLAAPAGGHSQTLESGTPFPAAPVVGPASGAVIVAGGGMLEAEIWSRFVELAGGDDARIVVVPTAGTEDEYTGDWDGLGGLRDVGAGQVAILHTRDPRVANTERFVAPLREATGVWIPGGRPWRLVDAYLGTRVLDELSAVLERGGVVGGTSAGASILASFLVRGDPATNRLVLSDEYREGFGLLRNAAVDQHLFARNRQDDLWEVLAEDPELLGIGLDEGTALVVHEDLAEVIGTGLVLIYDASGPSPRTRELVPGDRYHLGRRIAVSAGADDARSAPPEHVVPR